MCSRGGNAAEWDRGSVRAGGCGRVDGVARRGEHRGGGSRVVRDRCLDFLRAATVFLSPGGSVQLPEVLPNTTSLMGVTLVGQAVTYNPSLTQLGLVASNAVVLSLGY